MAKHTLAVLVDNSSGVLARVASLFARRAYNIDSLAVGPTEDPSISRMTIVINVEGHALEQVIRQLDKLINVIHVSEIKPAQLICGFACRSAGSCAHFRRRGRCSWRKWQRALPFRWLRKCFWR